MFTLLALANRVEPFSTFRPLASSPVHLQPTCLGMSRHDNVCLRLFTYKALLAHDVYV